MVDNKQGYKDALKGTSLFGGVQFITILISVIRTKIIAVLIGPTGLGLMSLLNSTIVFVSSLTNMGLSSSAVRDIAQSYNAQDVLQLSRKISAIRKCVFLTGILGATVTVILSSCLSQWTFEVNTYTYSFVLLSIVVYLTAITGGNNSIIQGFRKLRFLALSTISSSIIGLIICIPIFYLLKENGVVVFLLLMSLSSFFCSCYYYLAIKKQKLFIDVKLTLKQAFNEGKQTIQLGLMMSISAIFVSLTEFIVKAYITRTGGLEDVGFYQAGWAINASYLGLVFTAMATDYYPRLSSFAADNQKVSTCVNQQSEIALLILGPLIIGMLIFLKTLISILYTDQFVGIEVMTRWLLIGSLIKACSWAISFIFLAKGAGKLYLINEVSINLIMLPSYLLGYNLGGLEGIGLAFMSNYIIYFIGVSIVAYKQYKFKNSISLWRILGILLFFSGLFQFLSFSDNLFIRYFGGSCIFVFVLCYCLYELDKRIHIRKLLDEIKKRF